MRLLDGLDLVNAYGLTETSSTVAVLGPDDHRAAFASDDPAVRERLGSVGRVLPGVELSIRDPEGSPVPDGELGEIWVRGEQVSGEYLGVEPAADDGWFNTRDSGRLDDEGYLFVHGRLDDVIVRGGENLSPGEIETVLVEHPAVESAAVVGIPDVEWGERVVAAVVLQPGAAGRRSGAARPRARRAAVGLHARAHQGHRRAAVQRDRQAPAPGAARRAGRRVRPTAADGSSDRAGAWRRARCRAPRARSRRPAPPASTPGARAPGRGTPASPRWRTARGSSRCPRGCSCRPG